MYAIRNARLALVIASLAAFTHSMAFDPSIDLKGATALAQGQCVYTVKEVVVTHLCFIVKKDAQHYVVAVDAFGPRTIFQVDSVREDYAPSDLKLVWERLPRQQRRGSDA